MTSGLTPRVARRTTQQNDDIVVRVEVEELERLHQVEEDERERVRANFSDYFPA